MNKNYSKLLNVELHQKQEVVSRFLAENDLDGIWLTRTKNFAWYTGGLNNLGRDDEHAEPSANSQIGRASLLIQHQQTCLIVDRLMTAGGISETLGHDWKLCSYDSTQPDDELRLLEKLTQNLHIGADISAPGFSLVDNQFSRLSRLLMASEQLRYRMLCRDCTGIVERVLQSATQDQTEHELGTLLTHQCHLANITPIAVTVMSTSAKQLNDRPVSRRKHNRDNYVCLRLVGSRGGLHAAVTRMAVFGTAASGISQVYRAAAELEMLFIHHTRVRQPIMEALNRSITSSRMSPNARLGWPILQVWAAGYGGGAEPNDSIDGQPVQANQAFCCAATIRDARTESTFIVGTDGHERLTETDNWPMFTLSIEGTTYYVPDILHL